jgi:hypothetical protein
MNKCLLVVLLIAAACASSPADAAAGPPPAGPADRWYYGGGIGASFGDVEYISINPLVGYSFTPKLSAGTSLFYVYRDDSRYDPDVTTNDYGGDLFLRYRITQPVYLQAQYSYWNYEVPTVGGGTFRDSYNGYLAGGGFVQPLGNRAAFYFSALYDFNYADDEPSPYDNPWVMSAGVTVGF